MGVYISEDNYSDDDRPKPKRPCFGKLKLLAASETLSGVTQLKIGDICFYSTLYIFMILLFRYFIPLKLITL